MTRRRSYWERLQQLWVVDEPLSGSEQAFRVEMARDPDQRRELQFYDAARRWIDVQSKAQAEDDARFLEHALRLAKSGRSTALRLVGDTRPAAAQPPRVRRTKQRVAWAFAGLMVSAAASAAIALVWHGSSSAPLSARSSKLPQLAQCRLASVSGVVQLPSAAQAGVVGASLHQGDTLTTALGTACLAIDETVRVCLPNDSSVTLTSLDPRDLRISVLRGGSIAALSPRPPGSFFSLVGGGVVATAHGTIYALELTQNLSAAEVSVFEGTVELEGANQRTLVSVDVRASFDAASRTWSRASQDPRARERWLGWLHPPAVAAIGEASPIDSAAPSRVATAPSANLEPAAGLSREALFAAARKQAALGNARAARALYREVSARYPGPGTASVQVVLGNLEMELAAPERALSAFDGYLRYGGALEPEALHGKVRALRALGRTAEERATIRTYLARYPHGFQAPTLKKRLQELE